MGLGVGWKWEQRVRACGKEGVCWGTCLQQFSPYPQCDLPEVSLINNTPPPPTPYTHLAPFCTRACCTPPLTNHQALFPKRIRFVLTGVGFQCYSKLSVILMISLRGRDRKMNRFSLSFPHNCEWAREGGGPSERGSSYRCMHKRGFDWANIITWNEIKTVNESLFHSISPSVLSLLSLLFFIMRIPNLFHFIIAAPPVPHRSAICMKIMHL